MKQCVVRQLVIHIMTVVTWRRAVFFSYSKEDIAEHYANLATSVITYFSAEFKMDNGVKCLNKILDLLEQEKD